MIAADRPEPMHPRLLHLDGEGFSRQMPRDALATLFDAGDLVVANDAATLPASLACRHAASGARVEVRLAGWVAAGDPTRFAAIVFGAGDYRTPTEHRPPPPEMAPGDDLILGPLRAAVARVLGHPRRLLIRFAGSPQAVLNGIVRHGRPIQYAHVPEPLELWDVWTRIAAEPVAFEPPSAGFALTWQTLAAWRARGVGFATLTHAAGISSTGDAALDRLLPFDEPYRIPAATAAAIARTRARGGRVVAIGTTVVRALEAAARDGGRVPAGRGIAQQRIGPETRLRVVDAILSGVHQAGESHFELLGAFADRAMLERLSAELEARGYRAHEFGDSVLIERRARAPRDYSTTAMIGPYRDQESLRLSSGA